MEVGDAEGWEAVIFSALDQSALHSCVHVESVSL